MMNEYAVRVLTLYNTMNQLEARERIQLIRIASVPNMDSAQVGSLLNEYRFQAVDPTEILMSDEYQTDDDVEHDNKKLMRFLGSGKR